MTEFNVHPVTAKWPEGIRAVPLEGTLTYKAIRHAHQPKKCPSWAMAMIIETHQSASSWMGAIATSWSTVAVAVTDATCPLVSQQY